jgi:hypothetical protein
MTPPKAAVLTPDGRFFSLRLAAAHYGISYTTARRRARQGQHGWRSRHAHDWFCGGA